MTEMKTIKFQLMLSKSEAAHIDEWMFSRRLKSRAEAIRRLCKIATESLSEQEVLIQLPPELLQTIVAAADKQGRSVPVEIVTRLEAPTPAEKRKSREKFFAEGVRVLMERYLENDDG